MNHILDFVFAVVIISASGVMAPGPLFAANIVYGTKESTRAGIKMAAGHTIVEFPLVILLGIGVFSLEVFPEFRTVISIVGAITLFIFAGIQIKSLFQKRKTLQNDQKHGAVIAGITLSALNPFFIAWWLSVGFKLISDAMMIWAFGGIIVLFLLHIWMDFAWLGSVAFLAKKSARILSNKNYKIMMLGLSISLIYFGITFLNDVI
ncbi:LysE family transporter [Nitrosopumilus sp. K4]|uniref:LysE family transporter n=1 Tax=Nitrosopumilus sp. K4 TaxID=2795383 RepID=UPI001BAA1332|nr:LysE family transporter [Nitrosopumilus sp. K4]QUC63854.1 LysE family transporter [Nitrosopumilus sp. K4]